MRFNCICVIISFLMAATQGFSQTAISPYAWKGLQQLQGTWQVMDKMQFEQWQNENPNAIRGKGYILTNDAKEKVTEYLQLVLREDGSIAYQATVPNQNDGATIEFLLTAGGETSWTFENPQHDFPKKIEYVLADSNTLNVFVSGDGKLLTFSFVKH